ncbi:MAG: hypothetical protein V4473_00770 [Patescibacteria group bacterium]
MALLEVEIKNLSALRDSVERFPKIAEPVLQKAIDGSQAIFAKNTLKDDPVPWRTGNLLHSFRFESAKLQARWFPTARYAQFVEYGRGAVYPKKAKMLSWINESGERVFARSAKASKPRPFMKKIVEKSQKDVQNIFRQAGEIIIREIVRLSN